MIFVLSVPVKKIRTSSEVVQVLYSWGPRDLCLQRAGELSLSGHLSPEGQAIFIGISGISQPVLLEVTMPFQVPGAGIHVSLP